MKKTRQRGEKDRIEVHRKVIHRKEQGALLSKKYKVSL